MSLNVKEPTQFVIKRANIYAGLLININGCLGEISDSNYNDLANFNKPISYDSLKYVYTKNHKALFSVQRAMVFNDNNRKTDDLLYRSEPYIIPQPELLHLYSGFAVKDVISLDESLERVGYVDSYLSQNGLEFAVKDCLLNKKWLIKNADFFLKPENMYYSGMQSSEEIYETLLRISEFGLKPKNEEPGHGLFKTKKRRISL